MNLYNSESKILRSAFCVLRSAFCVLRSCDTRHSYAGCGLGG
jgi:hypothetical protein